MSKRTHRFFGSLYIEELSTCLGNDDLHAYLKLRPHLKDLEAWFQNGKWYSIVNLFKTTSYFRRCPRYSTFYQNFDGFKKRKLASGSTEVFFDAKSELLPMSGDKDVSVDTSLA
jgi:hypothetical protein